MHCICILLMWTSKWVLTLIQKHKEILRDQDRPIMCQPVWVVANFRGHFGFDSNFQKCSIAPLHVSYIHSE